MHARARDLMMPTFYVTAAKVLMSVSSSNNARLLRELDLPKAPDERLHPACFKYNMRMQHTQTRSFSNASAQLLGADFKCRLLGSVPRGGDQTLALSSISGSEFQE